MNSARIWATTAAPSPIAARWATRLVAWSGRAIYSPAIGEIAAVAVVVFAPGREGSIDPSLRYESTRRSFSSVGCRRCRCRLLDRFKRAGCRLHVAADRPLVACQQSLISQLDYRQLQTRRGALAGYPGVRVPRVCVVDGPAPHPQSGGYGLDDYNHRIVRRRQASAPDAPFATRGRNDEGDTSQPLARTLGHVLG